jgi:hypothetical protein
MSTTSSGACSTKLPRGDPENQRIGFVGKIATGNAENHGFSPSTISGFHYQKTMGFHRRKPWFLSVFVRF